MSVRSKFTQAASFGALTATILMSLVTAVYMRHIDPEMPWGIIWLLILIYIIPIGAWLGAAAGVSAVLVGLNEKRSAGMTCLLAGGVVLAFFVYFAGWVDDEIYSLFAVQLVSALLFCVLGLLLLLASLSRLRS
jgi:hypothetical protein